ncbi:MAG: hypothetical protein ISR50_20210 [Alphaproteobacteria bacterium]|nr:hypothetical protein [Alphaproteobacteria bacterium]
MGKTRSVGRILGWLLLALAFMIAGAEAMASLRAGEWQPMALGQLWYDLDRGSLNLMQALVQRYLHPAIWDPGVITILQWPAWLVAVIPAAVLLLFTRRRRSSFSKS